MRRIFLISLMVIFWSLSWAQSFYNIDSLEMVLDQKNDPQVKITILTELSNILLTYNPEQALDYSEQILEIAELNRQPQFKLRAYLQLSEIYLSMTELVLSTEFALKARDLAENMSLDNEYAESLLLLSKNYTELGEYEKPSALNYQALAIFEEQNNVKGMVKVLGHIGFLYSALGNTEKALEYDLQSLKVAREINDLIGISRGLNNVAVVYSNMGEFESFRTYIKEAIKINKKIGHQLWLGINYANLGYINLIEDQYDSSFHYYRKAEALFLELNNTPKLAVTYTSISAYYSEISDEEMSLVYASKAIEIAEKGHLKQYIYEAAQRLHTIYISKGDSSNAYKYSLKEFQTKDSLNIENSITKLSKLELLYEHEKLIQEEKNIRQKQVFFYIIIGTILLFVLVLWIVVLFNRRRLEKIERQKLEAEIHLKNKELTSNVMSLMRKNEILSDMADNLLKIREKAVKDETKLAIIKIAEELQKSTEDDVWDEFELRFKQVHSAFYEKLLKRFPDLSPNEQKICAFLRLNMSTKEISELTGQRASTIEMARTRLRKKLGIANTSVNLITFLSQV
ncbi:MULTISPECIES: tetratricopeptide repeat protein [unclassified Lentimicrobium]|uniref:tetratricopeptide repeat protein n=1 Tax=unclassified Lentimicrobium TaxID=2677434 RepID=UPI0015525268|nr:MULTISPECIES: tetratricopeptide repeat protein [unclassified Lentimicrobium]NPD43968.1 tetratricopeptide repeat protein [Lentimicrobium sp. S6]NPD84183.1 tetratricopeptide repeat protein [Lentimicrobium sp. L6]